MRFKISISKFLFPVPGPGRHQPHRQEREYYRLQAQPERPGVVRTPGRFDQTEAKEHKTGPAHLGPSAIVGGCRHR